MFFHVFPRTCWTVWLDTSQLKWGNFTDLETFAATFPVTNSVLRTSFRSPTCCICATCFAVATSVNFPLHSVACDRLLRSFFVHLWNKNCHFLPEIWINMECECVMGWFPNPQHGRFGMILDPFSFDERSRVGPWKTWPWRWPQMNGRCSKAGDAKNTVPSYIQGTYL